jgi:Icc-related predicted phosphoesterase
MDMKERKFLVCSDLHGSGKAIDMIAQLQGSEEFSAIVVCGDITTYGSPPFVRKLIGSLDTKLLAVPGNCDTPETVAILEKAGCCIHARAETVDGIGFFGFGGSLPSPSAMPFEVEEETMVSGLERVAVKRGVMVTHTPPLGMNDIDHTGRHLGSPGLLGVARRSEARAVLSGHVHESRGVREDGDTVYVNPGPARGGYYAVLTLGQQVRVDLS